VPLYIGDTIAGKCVKRHRKECGESIEVK